METEMSRQRSGFALLESLMALVVLGIAGLSLVVMLRQALALQQASDAAERELQDANRVMSALVLLRGSELDRMIGRRSIGNFTVVIQRPEANLFRLSLTVPDARGGRTLLTTIVGRR
jgi:type II secretory pathway pseudopilin PulG